MTGAESGSADVVALGIHVVGEIEQVVGGAGQLARAHLGGEPGDHAEHDPAEQRRQDRGREHAQLRLLELLALEGDARDQERHGEGDAGDGAAAEDHGPAQRRGACPVTRVVASQVAGDDPGRLADHVAEQDPQGDRAT